ncbi:MFS transporter [Erwinia sp. V71]|uniref:MFS transporter n=1 Tax=Erwinia sp. V71 TaxID=3369424 RepID=UPI003F5DEB0B
MTPVASERLPVWPLLTLSMAAFITIVTEALPAGLLPQMAADLQVSASAAGQTITAYALGSLLTAIPLTLLTQHWHRRRIMIFTLAGFALANAVTAISAHYLLTLAARFLAGVAAGGLWAIAAGYAAQMAPASKRGRAVAIAMAGTPLALSIGVPAGTWLGDIAGWRLCFGIMSVLACLAMLAIRLTAPDFAGQPRRQQRSLREVLVLPGVRTVLFVVLCSVLAHNILYTYISPFLLRVGMASQTSAVLLLFGVFSLFSIAVTGALIDRYLKLLMSLCLLLFLLAAMLLVFAAQTPLLLWLAVALWGLAFGGAPSLLQTALMNHAGQSADTAQSMLVTVWNLAIGGGGMAGGVLLSHTEAGALVPAMLVLLLAGLLAIWRSRHYGLLGTAS